MLVEIFSDVVCPWCYVGKRRFESALAGFAHGDDVEVRWRSFELDPAAPPERAGTLAEHLAVKYGVGSAGARRMLEQMTQVAGEEGLSFNLDRARPGNTFDAHRLLHAAGEHGLQNQLKERLLAGYLCEGEPIGHVDTLMRLVGDAGLDGDLARKVLDGDDHAEAVRADEADARRLGISAVPFFVVDRALGVPGAQPAPVIRQALEQAWHASPTAAAADAPACGPDGCEVPG